MFFLALFALIPLIHNAQEISDYLPMAESAIEATSEEAIEEFQTKLDGFLTIPVEKRTFDNTIRAWDVLSGELEQTRWRVQFTAMVHPEGKIREYASKAAQKIKKSYLEALQEHPEIYTHCLSLKKCSGLSEVESYCLQKLLEKFRNEGMLLSNEQRKLFTQILQELTTLQDLFDKNVAEDSRQIFLSKEDLTGLEESWLATKEQNAEKAYCLTCDLPTYTYVLSNCSVKKTRQAMYKLFNNRAFPQNEEVLQQLISKRDKMAKLLGYPSYADYYLSFQMAKDPKKVKAFLGEIREEIAHKATLEFNEIKKDLPKDVVLTPSGQLECFDELYAYTAYKKKYFSFDRNKVAEYFPIDKTIQGLIHVYERFFSLSIQEVSHLISIPDLRAFEIRDLSGNFLGVILLDLFLRQGKCTHSGITGSLISASNRPAVSFVICNLKKTSEEKPALMTHEETLTLFHEFGHAFHDVLGRTEFLCFSGINNLSRDFIELPSQLLEQWMWDPNILKLISCHYLTQAPLPEDLIQNIIRARSFGIGTNKLKGICTALLSLALFEEGEIKNLSALMLQIWKQELPFIACEGSNHFYDSWWHLPHYGPAVYSYLWSQVYAFALFEKIRQEGLLNPKVGTSYVQAILSKGASCDPNQLLFGFLGKEPSLTPFLHQFLDP